MGTIGSPDGALYYMVALMTGYLQCSTSNQASTGLGKVLIATEEWGKPSQIRCDMGGENINVVSYVLEVRGIGHKSALVGKSVHNVS